MPKSNFESLKLLVFDVDGVLTDGTVLVLENGIQARRMSIRDGYALQLAVKKGLNIMVISGAVSAEVKVRLEKLGITAVFMGVEDKWDLLSQQLKHLNIMPDEVLFMGDDIPDTDAMKQVRIAACPADAVAEISNISQYRSPFKGGEGCVRDVIEKTLKAKRKWVEDTEIPSR